MQHRTGLRPNRAVEEPSIRQSTLSVHSPFLSCFWQWPAITDRGSISVWCSDDSLTLISGSLLIKRLLHFTLQAQRPAMGAVMAVDAAALARGPADDLQEGDTGGITVLEWLITMLGYSHEYDKQGVGPTNQSMPKNNALLATSIVPPGARSHHS